jgi:hypothetical protein
MKLSISTILLGYGLPLLNGEELICAHQLSNEFKFPIAAFHHAHETYLVPEVLKRAYGGPPAVAIFATNARLVISFCPSLLACLMQFRYKREAYRGSEFAAKILADNNLTVIMKVCRILT